MATAKELLSVAVRQLNVREDPPDSNNVRYNTWYYGREVSGKAYPWCMAFVQWVFDQAGVKLPARTASCGTLMNAAKSFGIWVTGDFQPGDVAIYDFSGKRRTTEHCGIVEAVLPGYGVQAIEGNTSEAGSQSNGGMVCRKKRPWKHIIGAVRPAFEQEDTMTGKEIYESLNEYLGRQPVPAWARAELEEAKKAGITDGANPMQLIPRYQAAIMALRAAKAGK
ncbi:MAG: CHAP domain-containing protein [Oscillospiraceae bacterium]|nr:CHAP domain-containing protein [Oscillospiraceae bacterium]